MYDFNDDNNNASILLNSWFLGERGDWRNVRKVYDHYLADNKSTLAVLRRIKAHFLEWQAFWHEYDDYGLQKSYRTHRTCFREWIEFGLKEAEARREKLTA